MFDLAAKINSLTLEHFAKRYANIRDMFPPTIYDQFGRPLAPSSSPFRFKTGDKVEVQRPYRFVSGSTAQ